MFPSLRNDQEQENEQGHGRDAPTDSDVYPGPVGTDPSASTPTSTMNSLVNREPGSYSPLPPFPPPPRASDSSNLTRTPSAAPTPSTVMTGPVRSSSDKGDRSANRNSLGLGLPPPHALPSDSRPIMLHLQSDAAHESTPATPVPLNSPPPAEVTLPPHPAHPALALMRTNSSARASIPRRPLSAPRMPSTRPATAPSADYGTQRVSYASADSAEKDRVLLDADVPVTDPSGRILQVDLPRHGTGAQYGDQYRSRDIDSRCRDSGICTSMTIPGAYREPESAISSGMNTTMHPTMQNGGGWTGTPINMRGKNSMNNYGAHGAYVMSDIGVPRLPRTVTERLKKTMDTVDSEILKYTRKSQMTGYALNAAIGMQVLISALITALSAVTTGRRTQVMTSVLGGAGTVVASYLARARGSNEPELSITRVKDLQRFRRTCEAFVQDCGDETGFEDLPGHANGNGGDEKGTQDRWDWGLRAGELDAKIRALRNELEHLLGNGNGERRLAPPV